MSLVLCAGCLYPVFRAPAWLLIPANQPVRLSAELRHPCHRLALRIIGTLVGWRWPAGPAVGSLCCYWAIAGLIVPDRRAVLPFRNVRRPCHDVYYAAGAAVL